MGQTAVVEVGRSRRRREERRQRRKRKGVFVLVVLGVGIIDLSFFFTGCAVVGCADCLVVTPCVCRVVVCWLSLPER